jgi:hypothetical protein
MADNKSADLIVKLRNKTLSGDVSWEGTENEGVFQAALTNYTLQILTRRTPYQSGGSEFVLKIFNGEAQLIDEIADTDIQEHISNASEIMSDLYQRARSIAMGLDKAIDNIISELGEDPSPGIAEDEDLPF